MSKTPYVTRYRVRDPFREFDSLVRYAFGPQAGSSSTAFVPAAESHRDGEDAVVRLELPGVSTDDVSVEVVDGRLVISGERRDESAEEGRRLREFRYGSFKRAFRLGANVTADQVSASYDAGVLTVRVTGAFAKPAGQKIEISSAAIQAPEQEPTEEA